MPQGFQVWDGAGKLIADYTTRLSRIIGSVTVAANGSLTDVGFSTGTPFAVVCNSSASEEYSIALNVTFSGNTMSWTDLNGFTSYPASIIIMYGVY